MIVSRQNRWIKDIRRLQRSKGDEALLEGPHLLTAALDARINFEVVLATPEFAARPEGQKLLARLRSPAEMVKADVLDSVADSDTPRGVVAIARLTRAGASTLPVSESAVYLFADGVQEPGNLGALARVAEAAGAAGLALAPGSAHPNHPRALRASAGSLLRLPVAREVSSEELADHLTAWPPVWLALSPADGEALYEAELPTGPIVLMVGAEGPGLGSEALDRAERRLSLPMRAPVESLNIAVAAALALFEIARRRR